MSPSLRDNFPDAKKRILAARVNYCCSNPDCRAPTSGPQEDSSKAVNVGVAAHITAAALGGPRFDPTFTNEQRADTTNGIWLCQTCAKLVDNDSSRFTADILRGWKTTAEQEALTQLGKSALRRDEGYRVVDKWVSMKYVEKSGIAKELQDQGYDVGWSTAKHESERVDLEGWERVLVNQSDGTHALLKLHGHPVNGGYLIFLKRKKP